MARRRSKVLTERQKKILEVLENYQENEGFPPTIRDIGEHASISSTSVVNYYLDQLQEMGYIERADRKSRGIRLVKPFGEAVSGTASSMMQSTRQSIQNLGQAVVELLQIPVVGRIVAGSPMPVPASDFSYYDPDSMVDVAASLLRSREKGAKDLFALEVQGDSMIDAMINDGDIVIMKPAETARNGEMVAIWLEDKEETTLKYFYLENGKVRLQPANPTMNPIMVDDPTTVRVQGKVVMVIRKVGGLVA
jgi:repressor LexA